MKTFATMMAAIATDHRHRAVETLAGHAISLPHDPLCWVTNAADRGQPPACHPPDNLLYWTTNEAAAFLRRKPQTLRKSFCTQGHFFGVIPKKSASRLYWLADDVRNLIQGIKP